MSELYITLLKSFARGLDNESFLEYAEKVENIIEEEKIMRDLK